MGFKKKAGRVILILVLIEVVFWIGLLGIAVFKTLGE